MPDATLDDAEGYRLECATTARPQDPRAWRDHHRKAGRMRRACRAARAWTQATPHHGGAWLVLGNLLDRLHDPWSADHAYENALSCSPDHVGILVATANHFRRRADYDRAQSLLDHAMELHHPTPALIGHYAITLVRSGQHEAAAAYVDEHRAVTHPYFAEAAARSLLHRKEPEAALDILDRTLATPNLRQAELATLGHQRGVALEALQHFDSSFAAHREGNLALGRVFNRGAYQAFADTTLPYIRAFDGERARSLDDTMWFVVGMPRSGSTLLEAILTACDGVETVGEAPMIQDALQLIATEAGDVGLRPYAARMTPDDWDRHAKMIVQRYRSVHPTARHIVDKMLFNYDRLDILARLFPGCRVVVAQRHPYDTCLSAFFQNFDQQLTFTRDLNDLGYVYKQHRRFLAAAEGLPIRMHTVQYEHLVDDLEGTVRGVLEFLGQPFEPDCLSFHQNPRQFATASHDQVRRPLYRSSMGRWRKYEDQLCPLFEELPREIWEAEATAPDL